MSLVKPSQVVTREFHVIGFDGILRDPDALPTGSVTKAGVEVATPTIAKYAVGKYTYIYTVPADSLAGEQLFCWVSNVLDTVTYTTIQFEDEVDTKRVSDLQDLAAGQIVAAVVAHADIIALVAKAKGNALRTVITDSPLVVDYTFYKPDGVTVAFTIRTTADDRTVT